MATIQKYDELNAYDSTLTTEEVEEFNYKKYFGEMLISDEEKAKREELAEKLEPIFALLFLMVVSGDSVDDCLDYFTSRYKVIAKDYLGTKNIPAYVGDHANAFGTEIIDATERNQDKDYFSSLDRAKRVAADEANTLGEYSAYADAIKRGCTKKRWHIISDKRTRHTHRVLSEKTIGIYKDFDVGGYKMRFPKDTLYSPDVGEIANCRCSVEYLGGSGKKNLDKENKGSQKSQRFEDVTKEWTTNITPSTTVEYLESFEVNGKKYIVDGKHVLLNPSQNELRVASLMAQSFGDKVQLVPRILQPQGIKTPDYIFRGERFDLKTIEGTGKNVLYDSIKKKSGQSSNFIFDITNSPLDENELLRQAEAIFSSSHREFVDKLILVKKDRVLRVMKRKRG